MTLGLQIRAHFFKVLTARSFPQTAEDLDELRKYLTASRKEMAALERDIAESAAAWELLERLEFEAGDAAADLHWATAAWPQRMQAALQECEGRLTGARTAFTKELARDQRALLENIDAIAADVKQFIVQGDLDQVRLPVLICDTDVGLLRTSVVSHAKAWTTQYFVH